MSIGFFTDARLIMGDTVITSIVVDMTQPRPHWVSALVPTCKRTLWVCFYTFEGWSYASSTKTILHARGTEKKLCKSGLRLDR